MDVRPLVFADDQDAKPRLFACGKCGNVVSPKHFGGGVTGVTGAAEAAARAEACCRPVPPAPERHCACGSVLRYISQVRCSACQDAATIAKADVLTEQPGICVLVGTDTFFHDASDAALDHPGAWVHPCDSTLLHVNTKRLTEYLLERVVEDMCEEAFEDAEEHVNGEEALGKAIEAALTKFNEVQTASSWTPDMSKVYRLPLADTQAA